MIAGNGLDGINFYADTGSLVTGNFEGNSIGVGISGSALPNQHNGIKIDQGSDQNTIGGLRAGQNYWLKQSNQRQYDERHPHDRRQPEPGDRQLHRRGCRWRDAHPQHSIWGKISMGAAHNQIGGDRTPGLCKDSCNTIANNGAYGVVISDALTVGNTVRGNAIYSNTALGINLVGGYEQGNGVTANNPPSAYTIQPNDLMYHPVGVMPQYDAANNRMKNSAGSAFRPS